MPSRPACCSTTSWYRRPNPYNPFGVAVRVNGRLGLENGAETLHRETDFKRILLGVRGDLGPGWELEATASTTRDDGLNTLSNTSATVAARTAALASSTPATALNPFTAGRAASDEVLQAIWQDSNRDGRGRKDQASVVRPRIGADLAHRQR